MSIHNGMSFPRRLIWLLGVLLLAGCEESTTALSYLAVNHTPQPIDSITINDQGGILNVPAMGGGGKEVCCVVVPKKWHPGLTAKISWLQGGHFQRDTSGNFVVRNGDKVFIEGIWKTRTVPIAEYDSDNLGRVHIHFLPNDEVLVKIGNFRYRAPGYYPPYPDQPGGASQ